MNHHEALPYSPPTPVDRAVDATRGRRPGVPMELEPPRHAGEAHWDQPERTATPPRGISGVMRRLAYRIPEHHTSHWLVLLLADRVDSIESRPAALVALAAVGAGGVALAAYSMRRPWWKRWLH